MSGEIDVVSHTVSAGGGAVLTIIADRVIRFFTERDRHEAEKELVRALSRIETKLEAVEEALKDRARLESRIARLEAMLEVRNAAE